MSTLSVPLTPTVEQMIEHLVENGIAESKAALVRKAIIKFAEDQAVNEVLRRNRRRETARF